MTPIEIFWGLAINWASSIGEEAFKNALPKSDYLTQVAKVYHETLTTYTEKHPVTERSDKKYPFYESQLFYQACLKFHFYESLNADKIYQEINQDTRIISTTPSEIQRFLNVLHGNILANQAIKATFLAENYQAEIFNIAQDLQKIAIAIDKKANSVTINGNHNIVMQDLENIKEIVIALQNTEVENAIKDKEKLQAYQAQLAKEYEAPIWGEDTMSLKDTYIEQKYGIYRECTNISKGSNEAFIPTNKHLHTLINEWLINPQIINNEPIHIKNNRLILLLGQPGQGKSSFCKRLMYDVFHNQALQSQAIFRVNFREITDTADLINRPFPTLRDFINEEKNIKLTEDYFRNCLFVLDGLDELRIKENMSLQVENEFLHNLSTNLTHNYPNIRVIITSRHQVQIERFKNEFLILNLSLLSLSEEVSWLAKYRNFHKEAFLDTKTLTAFQQSPHLKELCEQPILLYMLAQVHTKENPIDKKANRATIYNHLFDQVIQRKWAKEGQIDSLKGIDKKMMRTFLREIGFAIFQSDNEYIHKSQIQKIIHQHPKLHDANNLFSKDALKGLMTAFYIQETVKAERDTNKEEDNSNYGIEFMHKSLQEFLAAEKIWAEIKRIMAKDTEGDYIINKGKDCLSIFYTCFYQQFLSPNIVDLLIEIINNEVQSVRTELANRIEKFFPYCIEHDFLYTYNIEKDKNPIHHALNVFYGSWTILSYLEDIRNYVNDNVRNKFCNILIYLRRYKGKCKLNLSYVDLKRPDLSGADLSDADLNHADLNHADLSGADLSGADLKWADLKWANLSGADLIDADLEWADLSGANLSRANLIEADLNHADLNYADLSGANLSIADLKGANLSNAYLNGAYLGGAKNITFAQLSQVKTLKYCSGIPPEIEKELQVKYPHLFE